MRWMRTLGWLACVFYSTLPLFWLMVHSRAPRWRARYGSPFRVLVPAWIRADRPMAEGKVLFDTVDLGAGHSAVYHRHLAVFDRGSGLQLGAIGWPAGSSDRSSGRSSGHHRHSLAGAASCLSRPSLRDAGLERRNWSRSLLAADRLGGGDGRGDDSHGRWGVGEALRRRVRRLPAAGPRGRTQAACMTPIVAVFNL
jgi:hypothetical protein